MAKESGPRSVSADPDSTTVPPPSSRSKFDLEPNPFEQSFRSGDNKRARSISPTYTPGGTLRPASFVRGTPRGDATNTNRAKVSLPGIAWIASPTLPGGGAASAAQPNQPPSSSTAPADHQTVNERGPGPLTALGWGLSSSLRSGPLSPALLNGPKDTSSSPNSHHHPHHHHQGHHHPSGLTPFLSGGPAGAGGQTGAFTPGTQALFNMITTSGATPNVSMPATLSSLTDAIPVTSSLSTKPVPAPSTTAAANNTTGAGGAAGHTQAAPRSFTEVQRNMLSARPGGGPPTSTSSSTSGPIPTTGVRGGPAFVTEAPMPSLPSHHVGVSSSTARDREGDFSSNPLYLLSAAQEAATNNNGRLGGGAGGGGGGGMKRHHSGSEEGLDDAAVVAAAALTGLGTPGGHHSLHHPHHLPPLQASQQSQGGATGGYFPYAPPTQQTTAGGQAGQGGAYYPTGGTGPGARYLPGPAEGAPPSAFSNGIPVAGAGSNGRGGGGTGSATRGRKRKAAGQSPPANGGGSGKRGRGGAAGGRGGRGGRKGKGGTRMDLDEEPDEEDEEDEDGEGGMVDEDVGDEDEFGDGQGPRGGKGKGGRGETDDEKRKNFLERNRQAALKCRQRKKAWLANLQAKVEYLTSENDGLQNNIAALREEIGSLRNILLAHKDCPIAISGGPVLDGGHHAGVGGRPVGGEKGGSGAAGGAGKGAEARGQRYAY